jgi:hypothetical protein
VKQVCSNAPGLWMGVERTSREDCHPWPMSERKAVLLGGGVFRELSFGHGLDPYG